MLLVILLIAILGFGIFINSKIGSVQKLSAIYTAKSSTVLYMLDKNETKIVKQSLIIDIIQLIYSYDKNIYEKSRTVKSVLCKDIPLYHMNTIKKYFADDYYKSNDGLKFKKKTLHNLELIEQELCVN